MSRRERQLWEARETPAAVTTAPKGGDAGEPSHVFRVAG
jgi:hypothetical protein